MITKAKILQLPKGAYTNENGDLVVDNKFKIYIPIFRRAGEPENSKLSASTTYATLCYNPGAENGYRVGDIVYVAFENNQIGEPVIIGKLFLNKTQDSENSTYLIGDELNISNKARLPLDTMIGDIKGEELERLFRQVATNEQSATLKIQKISITWDIQNWDRGVTFNFRCVLTTSSNQETLDTPEKFLDYIRKYCDDTVVGMGFARYSNSADNQYGLCSLEYQYGGASLVGMSTVYTGFMARGVLFDNKIKGFEFSYELQ